MIPHLDRDKECQRPPIIPGAETETILEVPVTEVTVRNDETPGGDLRVKAQRFVDLIKTGEKPWRAAEKIGTTLGRINTSTEMQAAIKGLLETATLSSEIRKAVVKAGLNKLFMENLGSDDPKDKKIALDAAKMIAADEGMNTGTEVGVTFNLGELGPALEGLTLDVKPQEIKENETRKD